MTGAVGFYVTVESSLSGAPWSVVDGLYMAVLTITTIGFAEVHPLSETGRVFTTGFAITGVVLVALAARSAASLLVGQQLSERAQERRRLRSLERMESHYIVCGYGRMGRETVHQLRRRGLPVVVIEEDPAALEEPSDADIPFIQGNATQDEHLRHAGAERAKCLIAAVGTDEDNLFIVLSARLLNPKLYIVARASQEETVDKLRRAGANSVQSPYVVGGRNLAAAAAAPGVVDFLEQVLHEQEFEVDIVAVSVPPDSPVLGKPMLGSGVMQEGGAMILGVIDADGKLHTNPRPHTEVKPGDRLIAMGRRAQLAALQRAVQT
jgi:voltage-gated potassium channel